MLPPDTIIGYMRKIITRQYAATPRGGILLCILVPLLLVSCARMGAPDGGWYDETPPYVVGAVPADKGTGVKKRMMSIYFNEYVKLENAEEKVVV